MMLNILQWGDIADRYTGPAGKLLLGNGASIAVSPSFSYGSLYKHAEEGRGLKADIASVFRIFNTEDFEFVLRMLWQAQAVQKVLCTSNEPRGRELTCDEKVLTAYQTVKKCLVDTVHAVHPVHSGVYDDLRRMRQFMVQFGMVVSLNYDLLVYWAMRLDPASPNALKDGFQNGWFQENWRRYMEPIGNQRTSTIVVYPHGNLALVRDFWGGEGKAQSNEREDLLSSIISLWESEEWVPLFVSEGTEAQKVASIYRSRYLSTVYREAIGSEAESFVVYGWGFGDHDHHILQKIKESGVKRIAVSVYRGDETESQQDKRARIKKYCGDVCQAVGSTIGWDIEVEFFYHDDSGCWIYR